MHILLIVFYLQVFVQFLVVMSLPEFHKHDCLHQGLIVEQRFRWQEKVLKVAQGPTTQMSD